MTKPIRFAVTRFHRRIHPRIDITLPVEYAINAYIGSRFCESGSIGGGGLMLFLPVSVPLGSILELKIHLPNHRIITSTVRIVWTELLTGHERREFKAGVQFEQISRRELMALRNFIRDQQNPFDPLPAQIDDYFYGK